MSFIYDDGGDLEWREHTAATPEGTATTPPTNPIDDEFCSFWTALSIGTDGRVALAIWAICVLISAAVIYAVKGWLGL